MSNDVNKKEDQLIDNLRLEGKDTEELIELVESSADNEEARDLIGEDNIIDPLTEDPYDSEETII
jgi:hypothetical protein